MTGRGGGAPLVGLGGGTDVVGCGGGIAAGAFGIGPEYSETCEETGCVTGDVRKTSRGVITVSLTGDEVGQRVSPVDLLNK